MTRPRNYCVFPNFSTDRDRDNRSDEKIGRNRRNRATTTSMIGTEMGTSPFQKRDVTAVESGDVSPWRAGSVELPRRSTGG
jgi:hypothetical protein